MTTRRTTGLPSILALLTLTSGALLGGLACSDPCDTQAPTCDPGAYGGNDPRGNTLFCGPSAGADMACSYTSAACPLGQIAICSESLVPVCVDPTTAPAGEHITSDNAVVTGDAPQCPGQ